MDIPKVRRRLLRDYIAKNFPRDGDSKGNVSAFANAIGIAQSQIADMLDGRKSFGEKVARRLEGLAAKKKMPPLVLDGDQPRAGISLDAEILEALAAIQSEAARREVLNFVRFKVSESQGTYEPQAKARDEGKEAEVGRAALQRGPSS
jgi:hypothetical protein